MATDYEPKHETKRQEFARTADKNQLFVMYRPEVAGEEDAIEKALRFGNRAERRSEGRGPGVQAKWSRSQKNRRNAKNRIAAANRKANR